MTKQERKLKKLARKEKREVWKSKAAERRIKVGMFFRVLFKICKPVVNKIATDILIPLATEKIKEKIRGTNLDLVLSNEEIKEGTLSLIDSI